MNLADPTRDDAPTPATSTARVDRGTRVILARARDIYRACLDPEAVACWRAPRGMTARVLRFEPRIGGEFAMEFTYSDATANPGKSGDGRDVFRGSFVELVPNERIVERIAFESDDPAFQGVMTIVTEFTPDRDGTRVTIACHDVPAGISAADHAEGIASSLKNLAAFVE